MNQNGWIKYIDDDIKAKLPLLLNLANLGLINSKNKAGHIKIKDK